MAEDKVDWYQIGIALKSILSKFELQLELSSFGPTHRMDSKQVEVIFYHLFLIIDPSDCRRRFRFTYPSKTSSDKSSFINEAIVFIENLKLNLKFKATKMILVSCGGELFRNLLGAVIEKACKVEMKNVDEKLANDFDIPEHVEQAHLIFKEKNGKLAESIEMHREQHLRMAQLEEEIHKCKENLLSKEELDETPTMNSWRVTIKLLFDKYESINSRRKVAIERIENMSVLEADGTFLESPATVRQCRNSSIRMSSIWREIKQKLGSEDEPNEHVENFDIKPNQVPQILSMHDEKINHIIYLWEATLKRAEIAILNEPEMKERFEDLVKDVPELKSIIYDLPVELPSYNQVKAIFNNYSYKNHGYAKNEIEEALDMLYRKL